MITKDKKGEVMKKTKASRRRKRKVQSPEKSILVRLCRETAKDIERRKLKLSFHRDVEFVF